MRQDKINGASLIALSAKYGCSKSTASLYCRDLISHPTRKVLTEEEARNSERLRKQRTGYNRKKKPCTDCGKIIRADNKTGFCAECWKIERVKINKTKAKPAVIRQPKPMVIRVRNVPVGIPEPKSFKDRIGHHKLIPCRNCQKPIRKSKSGLCKVCRYNEVAKARDKKSTFNVHPLGRKSVVVSDPCSKSPCGAHRWMLDNYNNGTCFYCDKLFKNGVRP